MNRLLQWDLGKQSGSSKHENKILPAPEASPSAALLQSFFFLPIYCNLYFLLLMVIYGCMYILAKLCAHVLDINKNI